MLLALITGRVRLMLMVVIPLKMLRGVSRRSILSINRSTDSSYVLCV